MAANSFLSQYKAANVAIKLIVINTAVYIGFNLVNWILKLQGIGLQQWFVLPSEPLEILKQPWGFITYAFLHGDFFHILFNMIFLYVFSRYVLNLFNEKRLLTIYFLGAIAGGLLFVLAYNLFPVLTNKTGYLLGASAAVNAIIVFIATYTPNSPIRILFFNLKLWHIAAFVVLRDLLTLNVSDNTGGLIAHLGGALFGYIYAQQLAKGNDIGGWWESLIDNVVSYFSKSKVPVGRSFSTKRSKMRTVHKKAKSNTTLSNTSRFIKSEKQQKIDAILDKIGKSGYDSLTKAEKDFLFKAGKE